MTFSELPVASPLAYACLRVTEAWKNAIFVQLASYGSPPNNFIPGCFAVQVSQGPAIDKYKALFEPQNTPFPARGHGLGPLKRLWGYLIRQKAVQKVFVKYIFASRRPESESLLPESQSAENVDLDHARISAAHCRQVARMHKPVKVIHRDHEAITAFCINKVKSYQSSSAIDIFNITVFTMNNRKRVRRRK